MIREVDLVSYLPSFMTDYREINQTLTAENPEFELVWKATDRTLKNEFIETADEYGISRFEKILHLFPSKNDTLEIRRARVQTKWFTMLPYTWRMFAQKIGEICGSDCLIEYLEKGCYMIRLKACIELQWQIDSLIDLIEGMLPCNMGIYIKNVLSLDMEIPAPTINPDWFGYAMEYKGVIAYVENSILIKTICIHVRMPMWGGTRYDGARRYDSAVRYNARSNYSLRVRLKTLLELYTIQAVRCAADFGGGVRHETDVDTAMMFHYYNKLKEKLNTGARLHMVVQSPGGGAGSMTVETRRNVVQYNGARRYNGAMKYNALHKKEEVD